MKKSVLRGCLAGFLGALCLVFAGALADTFVVPDGVARIEARAFENIGEIDAVYIPKSVTYIAADAFSNPGLQVFGHPGSAAEAFGRQAGRAFTSAAITDIRLTSGAWAAPDAPFTLTASATSAIFPVRYRFSIERNGLALFTSEESQTAAAVFTLSESGAYDVRIDVAHKWASESVLLSGALTVGERVKFASDPLKVAVGRSIDAISPEETRGVSIEVLNPTLLAGSGRFITGLKTGVCDIIATATQPEGAVTTRARVEVYTGVASVSLPNAPDAMFAGRSEQFTAEILPANAAYPQVAWSSTNEDVATVSDAGLVTALAGGDTSIVAIADGVTRIHPLHVAVPVTSIEIASPLDAHTLFTKQTLALTANALPETADNRQVTWQSLNPAIATVSASGVVTGIAGGRTQILCVAADQGGANAVFEVEVIQSVSQILLSTSQTHIYPGDVLQVEAAISPANAADKTLTWASDNLSIATVDAYGRVTAKAAGIVTVSATAVNGARGAVTLRVLSYATPTAFTLNATVLYLNPGETYQLTSQVYPEGAEDAAVWLSTNPAIAKIDANGKVTAVSAGSVQVGIRSIANTSIYATCKVTVLNPNRTLIMPARKTAVSGIATNKNKIASVRNSAVDELTALYRKGTISAANASARRNVIDAAFAMYSFPWMTLKTQVYWKEENSEGGVKDFQPGIVYYGMPYISNTYYNQRLYTPSKAVSENRYYLSSAGNYYILNQNKLYNNKYCGNDCSSMLAMSFFGVNASGIGSWNTHMFYTSSSFYTLSGFGSLRPGDILVRDWRHVVMFLYYANADKTQIVIIEQGGTEAGTNTVSTSVMNVSYYASNDYIARRRSS